MTKLILKQNQLFNDNEISIFNFFIDSSDSNSIIKTVSPKINLEKNNFLEKMILLKSKSHGFNLFNILNDIYNNVGLDFANKYLEGFLEHSGISFSEFLNLNNN